MIPCLLLLERKPDSATNWDSVRNFMMKSISKKSKGVTHTAQGSKSGFKKKVNNKKGKKKNQNAQQGSSSGSKSKNSRNCYFCNKPGHVLKDCEKLQKLRKAEKEVEL